MATKFTLQVENNAIQANDPLGQTHCLASTDHYSHLKFVVL